MVVFYPQAPKTGTICLVEILYSDEALLVINKPAGLLSLPVVGGYPHVCAVLEPIWGRLWIVHRLDRETSGVMVLARNAAAHRALNTQFQERQIRKAYHALIWGNPPWEDIHLDMPLRTNVGRKKRTVAGTQGRAAATRIHVLRRLDGYTLVEAQPLSGRRHQIRAHLYAAGYPLVGDVIYGNGTPSGVRAPLERLGLHAYSLGLRHPLTEELVTFMAPYPPDFSAALA